MKTKLLVLSAFLIVLTLLAGSSTVTITQDVSADIVMQGQVMGATKLKAGQVLELVSREGDFVILKMGGNATVKVPVSACQIPPEEAPKTIAPAPFVASKADITTEAKPMEPAPVAMNPTPASAPGGVVANRPAAGSPPGNSSQSQFALNKGAASAAADSKETEKVNPNWKLVWSDEFDGDSIDKTKWDFEVNGDGGGNNELQYYTDRKKNAEVRDGKLIITALKEDYTGPDGKKKPYTSARLRTKGKGDWKYGRIEARIKLVKGKGMWPAFWMMPTDAVYGGWARSGELDIMELVGHQPNTVYGTLHYGDGWPRNVHTGDKSILSSGDFADDFHVFAVEWEEGVIRWYLDGVRYQTQTKWFSVNGPFPAPFDQKFFIILNLAVGGAWPGAPAKETKFPQSMEVDYVRVYQPAGT